MSRIFKMSLAAVYPHYLNKVKKKNRTQEELDQIIQWLTGYTAQEVSDHLANETTFEDFFDQANLNPHSHLITGSICGIKVETITDPLMQKIRYLDKLVDELSKGKAISKVLRSEY